MEMEELLLTHEELQMRSDEMPDVLLIDEDIFSSRVEQFYSLKRFDRKLDESWFLIDSFSITNQSNPLSSFIRRKSSMTPRASNETKERNPHTSMIYQSKYQQPILISIKFRLSALLLSIHEEYSLLEKYIETIMAQEIALSMIIHILFGFSRALMIFAISWQEGRFIFLFLSKIVPSLNRSNEEPMSHWFNFQSFQIRLFRIQILIAEIVQHFSDPRTESKWTWIDIYPMRLPIGIQQLKFFSSILGRKQLIERNMTPNVHSVEYRETIINETWRWHGISLVFSSFSDDDINKPFDSRFEKWK